jgi:hypothetical protein
MNEHGSPRWLNVPRGMRRASLACLAWMLLIADEDGVVVRRDLADVLDAREERNLSRTIADLEAWGYVRRLRKPGPPGSHIRISYAMVYGRAWRQCLNCPRPVKNVRGARYCATCQASVARHDRAWKKEAVEIWMDGLKLKQSEALIVYRICGATGHPMFTPRDAGAEQKREGVVPWMLAEQMLVDRFWRDRMRSHAANEGDDVS